MRGPVWIDKIRFIGQVVKLVGRNRWSIEKLRDYQKIRFEQLRTFAVERSPFYKKAFKGLVRASLAELPVLTKSMYVAAFDDIATDRAIQFSEVSAFTRSMSVSDRFRGKYHVVASSGTTGERALFLFDPNEWRTALASGARAINWAIGGRPPTGERSAMVTTTIPWHMSARLNHELRRLGIGRDYLSFDAGEPIEAIVAKLNSFDPTAMVVYPSIMQILAYEKLHGRLTIGPQRIQCSAEVTTAEAREAIISAFKVTPGDLYAASECGGLAGSCQRMSGLHLHDDLHIVEVVDERGQAVPPGVPGAKVLLTVLGSRTLPLIRYELSDSLVLSSEPCTCGLPFTHIECVAGRTGDLLQFEKKDGGKLIVAPAQVSAWLRGLHISGWQLYRSPNALRFDCVAAGVEFPQGEITRRIEAHLVDLGAAPPIVLARRVERLARGATGKSTFVTTVAG